MAGPVGAPIMHVTSFNGVRLEPVQTGTVYATNARSFGTGSVAGAVPVVSNDADRLVITSHWLEHGSGKGFEATLDISSPLSRRVVVEILTDGLITVLVPGEALRAGGLGRPATRLDYEIIASACGTPLPVDAPNRPALEFARANDFGIVASHFAGRRYPTPPANRCSAG